MREKPMPPGDFSSFIADVPLLHSWDDGQTWNTGGFGARLLTRLKRTLEAECTANDLVIAETGAGNTTILFLLMKAKRLHSIAPDAALRDRILAYCAANQIDSSALQFAVDRSESFLPELAATLRSENVQLDIALMDGGHGWPTVFVDFCYLNAMLRKGGLLIADDLQLYSVNEFARWLSMQKEYSLIGNLRKTLIWRKETANDYLRDFGAQPYIQQQTKLMALQPDPTSIATVTSRNSA
jgi:hypothetical protein